MLFVVGQTNSMTKFLPHEGSELFGAEHYMANQT